MDIFEGIRNILIVGTLLIGQVISSITPVNPTQPTPQPSPTVEQQIYETKYKLDMVEEKVNERTRGTLTNENQRQRTVEAEKHQLQIELNKLETKKLQDEQDEYKQIRISNDFSYYGQSINYWVTFPKDGGDIQGGFSGACNGIITGKYAGGDGGNIAGTAGGSCKVGFLAVDLAAHYQGKIYTSKKEINVDYEILEPIKNTGSITLTFD